MPGGGNQHAGTAHGSFLVWAAKLRRLQYQQSVGRLSRMDAMQQQSMALAAEHRRQTRITRITAALARIDEDDFGYCLACGEDIEPKRLDADPSVPVCGACAGT